MSGKVFANIAPYLENGTRYAHSYNVTIGNQEANRSVDSNDLEYDPKELDAVPNAPTV